jgi:hypothetical protein
MKLLRQYISEICGLASADVDDAMATAQLAHLGQTRRSGEPYIEHPMAVAKIIEKYYPEDQTLCAIALLHDTLEDAIDLGNVESADDLSSMIAASFGDPESGREALRVVRQLTHEKSVPYEEYILSLLGDAAPLKVKLADMLHNLMSSPSPRQIKKYGDAVLSLQAASGGIPQGISPGHWRAILDVVDDSQNESLLRSVIKGLMKENFEPDMLHSRRVNDVTDAVVDRLGKTGLFDRGVPVSLINRIEKHADEILKHAYETHHYIANAGEDGFGES